MRRTEVPDDPYISCYERTGYPPWYRYITEEVEEDEEIDSEDDGESDE